MTDNLISIEHHGGIRHMLLQRLLRMVPERDRDDTRLQRLLAFRLGVDGEGATSEWLLARIRDAINARNRGPLYEFLAPTPPAAAGSATKEPTA
jgi:hypothetical protein